MPSSELEAQVLQLITERTEPVADGVKDGTGNLYTGRRRLKQEVNKGNIDCTKDELEAAVDALIEEGSVVNWHGLLAPATDEYLEAILENEREHGIGRPIFAAKVEKMLFEGGSDR